MAKPYSFEPRRVGARFTMDKSSYRSNADENERDNSRADTDRLLNSNWCICGQCHVMPTAEECVCCRELDEVNLKMSELSSEACITQHSRFVTVCLDEDVLRSVVVLLHDVQASQLEDPISNR